MSQGSSPRRHENEPTDPVGFNSAAAGRRRDDKKNANLLTCVTARIAPTHARNEINIG
jgi:hypothetical protein